MAYQVLVTRAAQKQIKALDKVVRDRVVAAIDQLADDPRAHGAEKLTARGGEMRRRVGDWRIVFTIDDKLVTVVVVSVANRREVYKR